MRAGMGVAGASAQLVQQGADPRRLIDRFLFPQRQVHRKMQEGVFAPGLHGKIHLLGARGVGKQRVVLGMILDAGDRQALQGRRDASFAMLAPGVAEKSADFFARGIEHGGFLCGRDGNGAEERARASPSSEAAGAGGVEGRDSEAARYFGAGVFGSYSHCAATMQRQHSGLRALHT